MRYPSNIREEELKNKVADDFFGKFDKTEIIKDIDFAVKIGASYLLWAEAKKSATDIVAMLSQLVLTIGKARTFNEVLPPKFLGCFDCEKIAFVPYSEIQEIFYQNDFNWNVTPSNRETKEFRQIYSQINSIINNGDEHKTYRFDFEKDEKDLKMFILRNFMPSGEINKIRIDKNNFVPVYNKWLEAVKPTILVDDWEDAKKSGIIDGDFYLADLLSSENQTLKDKLFVVLRQTVYVMDRHKNKKGFFTSSTVEFTDKQKAHSRFWAIYERPPSKDYWDYMVDRRDLLVPQDVRERKGAFYTPPQWVAKAHEYLQKTFGENWQDEYYVWDNSAGSGNLLAGLKNKDRIFASTLDRQDVDVMHDRIENGLNLWAENVFQFDFLNDDFEKLPPKLREIIKDPEKRRKLIFLINPPYGEAANARTRTGDEVRHKAGVIESKTKERFKELLGKSLTEKYVQFFVRIHADIPDCKMAAFVKPKYICGSSMRNFRIFWKAKYLDGFATPATTHDNCTGNYPICLFIWDLERKENFPQEVPCDIFNEKEEFEGVKAFHSSDDKRINDWIIQFNYGDKNNIGIGRTIGTDVQRNSYCWIAQKVILNHHLYLNKNNLLPFMVYFAVRHCIEHKWINDNDQYFYPKQEWESDIEFQNDCIAFTLFNSYNKIKSREGVNHWIPFTEDDVGCKKQFESRFMSGFIAGRISGANTKAPPCGGTPLKHFRKLPPLKEGNDLNLSTNSNINLKIEPNMSDSKFPSFRGVPALPAGCAAVGGAVKCAFSPEAVAVLDAGRELWRYYHKQPKANANAAFYDIREYFQGSKSGKMNTKSSDEEYNRLIGELRSALKALAKKIEPKVYEYGFLRG